LPATIWLSGNSLDG